jgi:hypothetical protein
MPPLQHPDPAVVGAGFIPRPRQHIARGDIASTRGVAPMCSATGTENILMRASSPSALRTSLEGR